MLRRLVLTAAITAGFAAAAAAEPYSDREKGFTVQVPVGWVQHPGGEYPLDLTLTSPRSEATGGLCLLMSNLMRFVSLPGASSTIVKIIWNFGFKPYI